jgi:DNA-nicking Smr family endonuclease
LRGCRKDEENLEKIHAVLDKASVMRYNLLRFDEGGVGMELDLHGMNLFQARNALTGALRRATAADYRLRVIHGYRLGGAIKDMIRDEFYSHPRVIRVEDNPNPGQTVLVLREY